MSTSPGLEDSPWTLWTPSRVVGLSVFSLKSPKMEGSWPKLIVTRRDQPQKLLSRFNLSSKRLLLCSSSNLRWTCYLQPNPRKQRCLFLCRRESTKACEFVAISRSCATTNKTSSASFLENSSTVIRRSSPRLRWNLSFQLLVASSLLSAWLWQKG